MPPAATNRAEQSQYGRGEEPHWLLTSLTVKGAYVPTYHRADAPDAVAPDQIEIRYLVDEPRGARNLSVAEGLLKPGIRSDKVYHTVYEEIWYFLQGAGVFHLHAPGTTEEETMVVHSGDAILVPPLHGFWAENTGGGDLVFLLCGSPPWGAGQEVLPWPAADTVAR
jgi:mannose-6-phosphate isomerase-like protein (cupin superfamily)